MPRPGRGGEEQDADGLREAEASRVVQRRHASLVEMVAWSDPRPARHERGAELRGPGVVPRVAVHAEREQRVQRAAGGTSAPPPGMSTPFTDAKSVSTVALSA